MLGAARGLRAEGRACGIDYDFQNFLLRVIKGCEPEVIYPHIHSTQITQVASRSLANPVYPTKHDGNGDNRYAIIIQGSRGDSGNAFEQWQFRGNVREMARILTEHPNNTKPGPGYTGYYLQDHIFYAGITSNIPEIELDYKIWRNSRKTSYKSDIEKNTFKKVASLADSYDDVIFYYTSHGGYYKGKSADPPFGDGKYWIIYLFDANDHHQGTGMNQKYSEEGDIQPKELNGYLNQITCNKLSIILQSCYSGNWIDTLNNAKNEMNRIIITSENPASFNPNTGAVGKKLSIFDKCNMAKGWLFTSGSPKDNGQDVYYVGDDGKGNTYTDNNWPLIDGEEYEPTGGESVFEYRAKYYNEKLIGIDTVQSGDFTLKFYENWEDNGSEFVSGLIEAFIIDRFTESIVESNNILDADESITNGYNGYTHYSSNDGDNNNYVSSEEAFKYMRLWHIGIRLNQYPWVDTPIYNPTYLEIGNNYLF